MIQKFLDKFLGDWAVTPNWFTLAMGDQIRKARKDLKLSQAELSKTIYVRQASISEMENGKRVVDSLELVQLSIALNKPIMYFFPADSLFAINEEGLSPAFQELLIQANRLTRDDLKKLIAQTKALANISS